MRLRAVLAGGLVLGIGTTATLAAWNDSEYATASLTSGSFSIVGTSGDPAVPTSFTEHATPATAGSMALTYSTGATFAPGTSGITRYSVRLASTSVPGTVLLQAPTVTGTTSAANTALATQLRYSVRAVLGTVAAPATPTCSTVFAATTGYVSIAEDQPLTFAPTVSQSLVQTASPTIVHYCVRLTLPTTATNDSQNATGMNVQLQFLGST